MRKLCFLFGLWVAVFGLSGCQTAPEKQEGLSAEQVAALKQQGFVESEEGWEFSASEKLLFGANEAALVPSAREAVERIAHMLVKLALPAVRVDGHTDATGSASYNDKLSLRRAEAVAEVLIAAGIPADNIEVRGLGSRAPVASNQTAEGRSQNRRVVLVIILGS
ncbi:OmpA family protein [Azonexus sp.]|jgi:outer membrane protein OmpA-like peptidoglycan-associated protein|uniref:OmpA family protein n=1 Tax=Azonexus sp. TaxID=1872668 RepID=UPI0028317DAB|nr:OmpA family protein [Azonexus sp.]MDR1996436.1 OmpA family protein [Azonexus sp.]